MPGYEVLGDVEAHWQNKAEKGRIGVKMGGWGEGQYEFVDGGGGTGSLPVVFSFSHSNLLYILFIFFSYYTLGSLLL